MPPWGSPGRMETVIDLTFDDVDLRRLETIDLTSLDDPRPSDHASQRPEVKVEDESSTLVGSSITDSGESSPNTQRTDDAAQTESNTTDRGDLSPRNTHDGDSDSSDDDLATVFARNRKRKNTSGGAPTSENKPSGSQLAPAALVPVFGSKSLKPAFGELWFNHNRRVDDTGASKPQQDGRSKAQQNKRVTIQQEGQSTNDANSRILNIDMEKLFHLQKETEQKEMEKDQSKPKTQRKPAKQQSRVDEKPSSISAPRRAVSEAPETAHRKRKSGISGIVNPSQPREGVESQRPHKRQKHSRQDDTISIPNSDAATLEDIGSQVNPANGLKGRISETHSVERDSVTGRDGVRNIHGGSSGYGPDDARIRRDNRATHEERRQKKLMARVRKQAEKSQRASSGRQPGHKASMLVSQNGRGEWARSGFQRSEMASQRPPKGKCGRIPAAGQASNHREAHQRSHGDYSGTARVKPLFECKFACAETARQDEDVRGTRDISEVRAQQSQQVHRGYDQRESGRVYSKADTAHSASRIEEPKQKMSLDARKKLMEDEMIKAKHFFENHPSNTAPQRKVKMTNFMPPDLSKPSFAFRSRMVNSSNWKRLGRKLPNAAQLAEKREKDRQRRMLAKRQHLAGEANRLFPNESEEHKEKWIEDRIDKMRQTFTKNDQKREAQKSQGFLTVDYLEDIGAAGSDRVDRPPAATSKGKRHGIPVAEALEPGATINLFTVRLSDPVEKGKEPREKDFKRLCDQFLRKEEANKHAEAMLRDEKYDDSHIVSVHFCVGPKDGLFWGTKELADGKQVSCYVQKERHIASLLDLGDTFLRKELKETYCSRFDVWYMNITPKVFVKKKKATTDQRGENARLKSKSNTPNADEAREPDPSEKDQADDDRDSLFSGTPTPEPGIDKSEKAEAEEAGDDDESDADSVASEESLAPSEPGGNLGSLTWNDLEYEHEHVGAFTTMELANEEAYKVARELWKPRGCRLDDFYYYQNDIKPSIDEIKTKELDVEAADLVFAVPECEGHVDDRSWPFVYSKVFVTENRLEGPRDIGDHYVMDNDEKDGEDVEEDEEDD